jgi:hypothetical protein
MFVQLPSLLFDDVFQTLLCSERIPPATRNAPLDLWRACLEACKADFQCSNDPCRAINGRANLCSTSAECVPTNIAFSYTCQCKEGYTGDGFVCKQLQPPRPAPGASFFSGAAAGGRVDYCALSQHFPGPSLSSSSSFPAGSVVTGHTCAPPCQCVNRAQEQGYR